MEVDEKECVYHGKFHGNILVVGRKRCGKTTFVQQLGRYELFGKEISDVFWVTKIILSKEREECIKASFENLEVHFSYPQDIDDFNYLIENFMQTKSEYADNNEPGENMTITQLIIMNDVSGLADKSDKFSNFLTVTRKYGFSCLHVFHTIYLGRQSWEIIMAQTHIFNFFPGSIHSSKRLFLFSLVDKRTRTFLINKYG